MKPVLLIIEDNPHWHRTFQRQFGSVAELLFAATVAEAGQIFKDRSGTISAIVVDGALNNDSVFNTGPLVRFLRSHFQGPVIAASSLYNGELVAAGCTHEAREKDEAVRLALKLVAK